MAEAKPEEPAELVDIMPSLPPPTDQQKELATHAMQEFEKKQYTACCNMVNKLMTHRFNDPKVVHNRAVAEYYNSGFQTTDEFRQHLAGLCQMAHVNIDNSDSLEDVDHGIIYFNQAVIQYHLHQYKAALHILDKLFQFIEPLEEHLTKKVLFLLVELYLCTFQPEKAMGMLSYMEKTLFTGNKNGQDKEAKEKVEESGGENSESYKQKVSMYKTRCLLMMKSMKSCKREIKTLMNTQGVNTSVIYLKSNFEYLRGNYRKANKMLGSAPQTHIFTEAGECLIVMYCNNLGCLHFHMRKHHLGSLYYRKAIQENENALKDMKKGDAGLSGKPLHMIGMSRHYELMYNMGIQLLHCGKPEAAFDCLIEAVQMYQINPRLWLRLAECCIMTSRENNDDDRKLEKRLEVIQGSVGSGVHRKLIMGPGTDRVKQCSGYSAMPAAKSLEFASLCLRNALMLLPDDPSNTETAPPSEDADGAKAQPDMVLVPAPPANPLKATEVATLRCSILAAAAYVGLCLNDFTVALHHAQNLLKQPRLSGSQRYLAHLYIAEASVVLDRIVDSIQHLNVDQVTDISTAPPEHKSDQEKAEKTEKGEKDLSEPIEAKGALYPWSPRDLTRAKAIMQYNLAAAHAIRGEYDKAVANLTESSKFIGTPLPAQMYFLKLYLDLMEGRRKLAQFVIKDHFGHVTPNRISVDMKVNNNKTGNSWSESPVP